ncbi:Ig-like domain repeat protein [Bacillus cereus]
MKRKNKIIAVTIASLAIFTSFFDGNIAQASTSESQVVKFSESTSRYRSQTINIPKLYKVTSITTDNGSASYTESGTNVTITVNNGVPYGQEAYTDYYKYSKFVYDSRTQYNTSFSSYINYYDGSGYSGTLSTDGSYYVSGGSYQGPSSRTETDSLNVSGHCPTAEGCSNARPPKSIYYNSGGYSGTLYEDDYKYDSWGDGGNTNGYYWTRYVHYSGTVYNPGYDTRQYTQDYSGTVYKSGISYQDTYAYNVTINYETDTTPPTGTITASPTTLTNGNVILTAIGTDSEIGMKQIKRPDGTYVSGSTANYTATTNGTYTFDFEDNRGNISTESYTVSNIDKLAPSGTFTPNSTSWTKSNVSVSFDPSDTGVAGVKQWRYRTSSDNGNTYGAWSSYIIGDKTDSISLNTQGQWKIQSEVTDNAGNVSTVTSGTHQIDKTNPSGTFAPNSTPWTKSSISVSFSPSDAGGSGVKQWRYRTSSDNGSTYGAWSSYTLGNASGSIAMNTGGQWKIEVEVTDNAGNINTVTSGTHQIDMSLPTATFNPNSAAWRNTGISVSVDPDDIGGSGVKQWRYRTSSDNGSTYGTWSTYTLGDTTGTISLSTQGQWKIQVEVTDNVGNINTVTSGVYNIDLTNPSGAFNPNSSPWTGVNIPITFDPSDTGGAGVKQWRYRTSSDNGSTYGVWSSYTAGDTNGTITLSSSGIWKVEVEVTDNAGNINTVTSGVYNIDMLLPDASFNPNTVSWINQNISVTIDPIKTGPSGIKEWKYRTSSDKGTTWNSWSSIVGDVTNTITFSATGEYVIEAEITTNAGLKKTIRSGIYQIDKINPTGNITAPTAWTNKPVTITATGSDTLSGIDKIKLPDGTFIKASKATYDAPVNGDYTFRFYDVAGNYYDKTYTVSNIETIKPFVWNETKTPGTLTNGKVDISILAGDADSGVKKITLPNGTSVNSDKATYTVDLNGEYTFIIEDNAGNKEVYISKVDNIDVNVPTISSLILYEYQLNQFEVTVDVNDGKGIKEVKLNTGQILKYNIDKKLYEITNLTTKPSSVVITDNAGNTTGNISFISAPTVTFGTGYDALKTMKENVEVYINGTNTLSFVKNKTELNCSAKPCTYTFTENGDVIAKHSQYDALKNYKAYLKKITISNIDKTEYKLVLEGKRNPLDKNEALLDWNLLIDNPKVTCQSNVDTATGNASGQSHKLTIQNETYNCWVEGTYKEHPLTSNKVTIYKEYEEKIDVDRNELQHLKLNTDVLMEKTRGGEFYVINARRSNFRDYTMPIPKSLVP